MDQQMHCTQCGAALAPGAAFCANCGAAVAAAPAQPEAPVMEQAPQQPYQQVPPQGAYQQQPYQQVPPQGAYQQPYQQPVGEPKSKIAAGLLAIFLGSLGIHNFYLGYTGRAVAQLLITLCTCGFGAIASGIWALVEGIQILTGSVKVDAKGIPLSE